MDKDNNLENIIICQGETPPDIPKRFFKTVTSISLNTLSKGSLVKFSGIHPASNYILRILERDSKMKLWYLGGGGFTLGGLPACFTGPGMGCIQVNTNFIGSFSLADKNYGSLIEGEFYGKKGFLEIGKNYFIPHFNWDDERKLYINSLPRTEPYKKIEVISAK